MQKFGSAYIFISVREEFQISPVKIGDNHLTPLHYQNIFLTMVKMLTFFYIYVCTTNKIFYVPEKKPLH